LAKTVTHPLPIPGFSLNSEFEPQIPQIPQIFTDYEEEGRWRAGIFINFPIFPDGFCGATAKFLGFSHLRNLCNLWFISDFRVSARQKSHHASGIGRRTRTEDTEGTEVF